MEVFSRSRGKATVGDLQDDVPYKLKHFLKSYKKIICSGYEKYVKDILFNQSVCTYNLQHAGYRNVITSGFTVIKVSLEAA